jgi:hypothetical protein
MVRLGRLLVVLVRLAEDELVVAETERVPVNGDRVEVDVGVGAFGLVSRRKTLFFVVTTAAANNALVFVASFQYASLRAGSALSVKIFDANMAVIATLVIIPSA